MRLGTYLIAVVHVLFLPPLGLAGQELTINSPEQLLQSGTPVKLQVAQTISSAHAHKNDRLDFVVVDDVVIDGFIAIRAGAVAAGS